jgi:hypothetical protein
MNDLPNKETFELLSNQLGIGAAFVEKDWHVTRVIKIIAGLHCEHFQIIFTGGTALAKAYDLLQRFSEDVDFRAIPSPEVPQNRKSLSRFKDAVIEELRQNGFAINADQIKARDENRFFSVELDYESYFARADALRPHIQVEVKVTNLQRPPIYLPVASFVGSASQHPPEIDRIACIDPVESAADKLSAIAWRITDRVRGGRHDDPSIVRHLHDLALLKDSALAAKDFSALVSVAMQEDDARAKNNPAFSGMTIAEKFNYMLHVLDTDKEYRPEYVRFVQAMSYAAEGKAPDFQAAIQAVHALVNVAVGTDGR